MGFAVFPEISASGVSCTAEILVLRRLSREKQRQPPLFFAVLPRGPKRIEETLRN